MLVAAFPQPADGGGSAAHTAAAGVAFVSLGGWPLLAGRPGSAAWPAAAGRLGGGRRGAAGLVAWFFAELVADSGRVGLSERVAAGAQALWPMLVAWGSTDGSRIRGEQQSAGE